MKRLAASLLDCPPRSALNMFCNTVLFNPGSNVKYMYLQTNKTKDVLNNTMSMGMCIAQQN